MTVAAPAPPLPRSARESPGRLTWGFVARRLASGVLTLLIVLALVFWIFQVLGDPARETLPVNASQHQVDQYRHAMGLDDPLAARFGRYFSGAVHLDFGTSTVTGRPAMSVVMNALPNSLVLAAAAFLITVVAGMAIGIVAGLNAGNLVDRLLLNLGAVASSVPEFWSGLVLIIVFAVTVEIFPTGGSGGLQFLVLPAVAMAIPPIGRLAYVVRESVRDTAAQPFVLVARSKGLGRSRLVGSHILRAAAIPIISMGGLELTRMAIGGVVVVESVFSWPGLGRLYVEAMSRYDVALVSATLFVATAVVLVLNIALDLLYAQLDSRVAIGGPR